MRGGPTYYDFFGVGRTASADQIRAAYLWLMKTHHPDLAKHGDKEQSADFAAILNHCYDVLKDPAKRARYDAHLERQSGIFRKRKVQRRLLTGETRRQRRSRWDASSVGAAALAAMVVLIILTVAWSPSGIGSQSSFAAPANAGYPAPASRAQAGRGDFHDEVHLAISATPDEAERASERCFSEARTSGSIEDAERCVVYDEAYLRWSTSGPNAADQPPYFDASTVWLRHRDALAAVPAVEMRLYGLREAALYTLLDEIRSETRQTTRRDVPGLAMQEGSGTRVMSR